MLAVLMHLRYAVYYNFNVLSPEIANAAGAGTDSNMSGSRLTFFSGYALTYAFLGSTYHSGEK